MKDEREDAVEKVLAALGRTEVPEGLEARVAEGLARRGRAVRGVGFGWREMLAGSAVAGVWWRGALVGAAVSMLVVGGVMGVGHLMQGDGAGERVVRSVEPVRSGAVAVAASETRQKPCERSGIVRAEGGAWRGGLMRVKSAAPTRGYVAPSLTAQEQALVHLARTSDPKELAMLNPEARERQLAQEDAQFQRFFVKPAPVAADAGASTTAAETVVGGPGLAVAAGEASSDVREPVLGGKQ